MAVALQPKGTEVGEVLVEPELTVGAAHDLVDRAEEHLRAAFPDVIDIVVHVEPVPPKE